jgi:hypothetical protein
LFSDFNLYFKYSEIKFGKTGELILFVYKYNLSHLPIFFLFGQVDVDFVFIHKYLENNNVNYKDFNLNVIQNYLNFITTNFNDKKITVLSIGLPCLDDDNLKKGLLNGHINYLETQDILILEKKMENVNLPDIFYRTEIALNFNEQLNNEIIKLNNPNVEYLDTTICTYDFKLKRIKDLFFSRVDHHNDERNTYISEIINNYLLMNTINNFNKNITEYDHKFTLYTKSNSDISIKYDFYANSDLSGPIIGYGTLHSTLDPITLIDSYILDIDLDTTLNIGTITTKSNNFKLNNKLNNKVNNKLNKLNNVFELNNSIVIKGTKDFTFSIGSIIFINKLINNLYELKFYLLKKLM